MTTLTPVESHQPTRRLMLVGRGLMPNRRPARVLTVFAVAWFVSALVHVGVFFADDTAWTGAVSWRKPIVFSVSIGLLLWTFGWVLDRLPHRRLSGPMAWAFAVSSTIEVSLVLLQQWRGRPSHFNTFTGEDAAIFGAMGAMVAGMSVLLVGLFVWSLIERPVDPHERLAIIGGLALVMVSLGFGQWLVTLGVEFNERFDRVPETVIAGEAGVPKYPHGIGFHGMQVFAIAALMLRQTKLDLSTSRSVMRLIVFGYVGFLVTASMQAMEGRSPSDFGLLTGGLALLSLLLFVSGASQLVRAWRVAGRSSGGNADPLNGVDEYPPGTLIS